MIARATANTTSQYRVRVGRKTAAGAALGGEERIETSSTIAVGMLEERPQPGNLFLGFPFVIEPARERT
jgi:hypothetical protein